ncbi:caspase family protein [Bradyrhizobium cenepequi]
MVGLLRIYRLSTWRIAAVSLAIVLLLPCTAFCASPTSPTKSPNELRATQVAMSARKALLVKGSAKWDNAFDTILSSFKALNAALDKQGVKPAGNPIVVYTSTDDSGFSYIAEVAVDHDLTNLQPPFNMGSLPFGSALKFVHRGSYDKMDNTYEAITKYLDERKLEAQDTFVEEYVTNPIITSSDKLEINVYVPLKSAPQTASSTPPAPAWSSPPVTQQQQTPSPVATVAALPPNVAPQPQPPPLAQAQPAPAANAVVPAGRRVALVVGNSAYRYMPSLQNPRNDAADVESALKSVGFETILATDLDRSGMNNAMERFSRLVPAASVAIVYYSGHGMQFEGKNYLLPVDASLEAAADVNRYRLMPLGDLIELLRSANGLQLIVLDACRNNPIEREFKNKIASLPGGNRDAASTRGFARIDARNGLIITYATAPDSVASDGNGRNSPFTLAFLKNLVVPDIDVRQMLFQVQSDVYAASESKQLPEISSLYVGPPVKLKMTTR